jgi:hypothetical protein
MDLKRATIQLEADGFRITDQGAGFEPGVPLTIQYEAGGAWSTKEIPFEREPWSLFHPFRTSMFVYTGAQPTRVLIRAMDGGFSDDLDTAAMGSGGATARRRYYQDGNFRSYPDFDDDAWDSDDYRSFFPSSSHSIPSTHSAQAEAVSGSVSAEVPRAEAAAPVEAAPFADATPSDKSESSDKSATTDAGPQPPLEYDPRDVTASGRVEASSESLAPAEASSSLESDTPSSSAEPNAY